MSGYTILIAPRVRAQFDRILDWWDEHRPENPGLVAMEFKEALGILAVSPSTGASYPSTHTRDARRVLLPRTQYHVYYRVKEEERIVRVLALWHAARGQGPRL